MPYTKRTSMRSTRKPYKKYYKRKTFYKKTTAITRRIAPEYKMLDSYQSYQGIGNSSAIYGLTVIAENDDYYQRTGLGIQAKSIYGRMQILSDVDSKICSAVRAIVFIDKEARGTAPTGAEVLENAAQFQSPILHTAGKRIVVLYDRTFSVDPQTSGKGSVNVKFYRKLNHIVRWTTQFGSNPSEGSMFLLLLSDNASADPPQVSFWVRLRFIDA